jgi:uncharacterized alpha-E superfamily protein
MGHLRSDLAYMPIDDIMAAGLHEFIDRLQNNLNRIGESVYDAYLAMRPYSSSAIPPALSPYR